jgi:hypothetical protein
MEGVVTIAEVEPVKTRSGTIRFVVKDTDGNEYLDKVEPAPAAPGAEGEDSDPEEAAWRTAVDAAPWFVGESDPDELVPGLGRSMRVS